MLSVTYPPLFPVQSVNATFLNKVFIFVGAIFPVIANFGVCKQPSNCISTYGRSLLSENYDNYLKT